MTDNTDFRLGVIETDIKEILNLLNGKDGLVTKVELHAQRVKAIPSPTTLKWYAGIGSGIISSIGIIMYIIYQGFRNSFTGG